MNIAIDIRSTLKRTRTGIGQYTFNLIKNLALLDNKNQYSLYAKPKLFSLEKKLPEIKAKNFKFRIDSFNKGLVKTLGKVDVFHTPSQDLLEIEGTRIIVTVHDLIFKTYPDGHSPDALKNAEKQLLDVIARADKIICYSQSTKSDLQRFYDVKDKKIKLIYVGVDKDIFYPMEDEKKEKAKVNLGKSGIKDKFILFVGTIEPRKNIDNLILAFNNLKKQNNIPHQLIIVGMKGWLYEKTFVLRSESEFKDDILFLDYQSSNKLKDFYNLADVFVYPSFYEGFGFPILEAFSCAAPVITSHTSSCKEIGEDAALLVEPSNVNGLSDALLKVLTDSKLKNSLKNKGLEKSKMFSWQKAASETLETYKEVLQQ